MSTLIQRQTDSILLVKGQGQCDVTSIDPSYCEHDISRTPGGNFLQIWHKRPLGVTDELNGICGGAFFTQKVKGHLHCDIIRSVLTITEDHNSGTATSLVHGGIQGRYSVLFLLSSGNDIQNKYNGVYTSHNCKCKPIQHGPQLRQAWMKAPLGPL